MGQIYKGIANVKATSVAEEFRESFTVDSHDLALQDHEIKDAVQT
jgi:hypothetical protein